MKINFSLSLKLTIIVVSVSAIIIFSLTYGQIMQQTSFLENAYFDKATSLSQAIDASIGSRKDLQDKEKLMNYILKFMYLNPEVLELSINLPEEDELMVAYSSDRDTIGSISIAGICYH